jgi:two-component system, OmpR family, phosphate regulon sensor histidine kinase PhoR
LRQLVLTTIFFKRLFFYFYFSLISFSFLGTLVAGYLWSWPLKQLVYFNLIIFLGAIFPVALCSFLFSRQYGILLSRTYKLSSKFHFLNQDLQDSAHQKIKKDLFVEMDRALRRIRSKLLESRKKLAHELEQVKALMSSLQDAVVTIQLNNECLYFNAAFATSFLESEHLENFKRDTLYIAQAIRSSDFLNAIQKVKETGKHIQVEMELPHKINSLNHDYLIKISPLFEEKDRKTLYGVLILFHDVTHYKATERLRMQFVENASHELRTPLTSVKGYLDLAIQDTQEEALVRPLLLNASLGVSRLVDLVQDLLDLSKLDKSSSLDLAWINPLELTDRVFQILNPMANTKQIQLKMQVEFSSLRVDESKMEQILMNLIANAIQYNPSGTKVQVLWIFNKQGHPQLIVEDDGIGISEKHWDRLFDRFYRIEESRDRSKGGTGLGLAIVKQLVESHGARIHIQKASFGRGTCFSILFKAQGSAHGEP